jgi:hypothetical protein
MMNKLQNSIELDCFILFHKMTKKANFRQKYFLRGVTVLNSDDVRRWSGKKFCSLSIILVDAIDLSNFMEKVDTIL